MDAERYHAPSDDLNQPIDRAAAGTYVEVIRDARGPHREPRRPSAVERDSFFKRFATGGSDDVA